MDFNGLTSVQFLVSVARNFTVGKKGVDIYKPACLHNFSLYLDGEWYSLAARGAPTTIWILSAFWLSPPIPTSSWMKFPGIKDLCLDKRIDFVGGIRSLGDVEKRVDSGEMKVTLVLYPVSMKQIMDIADTGNIMPPKTT